MSITKLLESLPPLPETDHALFGEIEVRPLSRIQQLGGRLLARNWVSIPHVTHHDELDIARLDAARVAWNRKGQGPRITLPSLLLKALVPVLEAFPHFNASLSADGKQLVLKKYFHIGVAVDTPRGLLVPVIRDCDRKALGEIAAELDNLSSRARDKGLAPDEMAGGCFSLSSIGTLGGTAFTPIINAPEVAILGATRVQLRPAPDEHGAVAWRRMLPVSLSYDHRVINGADAARFVSRLGEVLAEPAVLGLEA